jgi:hypothetical protein
MKLSGSSTGADGPTCAVFDVLPQPVRQGAAGRLLHLLPVPHGPPDQAAMGDL